MSHSIHPTALIDPRARLGRRVHIGAYAIIGPGVAIGDGVRIGPHAVIVQDALLGPGCDIGIGAVIGSDPQDARYQGEPTRVEIGEGTRIREYVTISRGTLATGRTMVGSGCYLMAYAHVGHDCVLEDHVTLANLVQLGGHVQVGEHASIGGSSAVHQFSRIGPHAFVGGGSHVRQDVPPYAKVSGNPVRVYGVNSVGLRRAGVPPDTRLALQHAFRLLFNSELTTSEAIDRLRTTVPEVPEVARLLEFFSRSERGVLV
jgi:UDP-N-acetylglucosamine acyltransferase